MISPPTSSLVPETPAVLPPRAAGHPQQAHLDMLVHAGIVTHLVVVQEALDPLFAVAQMRELPEVKFVAAFAEGLIALGCENGLPKDLQDIATPAIATAPAARQGTEDAIDKTLARMEKTAHKLEYMFDAIRPDEAQGQGAIAQAMIERMTSVEQILTQVAAKDDTARLNALKNQMNALLAPKTDNAPDPTADAVARLTQEVEKLAARPVPDLDLTAQKQGFDQFASVLAMSIQRMEGAASDIQAALPSLGPAPQLEQMTQQLADLTQLFHDAKTGPADLTELTNGLSAVQAGLRDVPEALSALRKDMTALAQHPKPVLDLTEQRRSFVDFATMLTGVVQRLENIVEDMDRAKDAKASDRHEELTTFLQGMAENIQITTAPVAKLAQIERYLENAADFDASIPSVFAAFEAKLDRIADRPEPVLDLTEQRSEFAQFGTELTQLCQTMQNAMDGHNLTPLKDRLHEVLARVNALPGADDLRATWETDIAKVVQRLDDTLSRLDPQTALLNALDQGVAKLVNRPDPTTDMAEQRHSLERFATLTQDTVDRLEATAKLMTAESADKAIQSKELAAVVRTLPEILRTVVRDASDMSSLENTIAGLEAGLQKLPDQIGLSDLGEAVATLSRRPSMGLELSAQRQSIARFGTALSSVIDKLDRLSEGLHTAEASAAAQDQTSQAFDRIEQQMGRLSKAHATDIAQIAGQIKTMAQDINALRESGAQMAAPPLSLDDLRMQFAELVASQIKQNATTSAPITHMS
jgi:hypothetical protein